MNTNNSQKGITIEDILKSHSKVETILCFSHLRWNFVYQRPQHLLTQASKKYKIYYIEEPIYTDKEDHLGSYDSDNVTVLTPFLTEGIQESSDSAIEKLLKEKTESLDLKNFISWYYTPMALNFTEFLKPSLVVFDCMDELSAFAGAPPEIIENEKRLIEKADIIFTGGRSLYESKKDRHENVYLFPSSIDAEHYKKARKKPDLSKKVKIGYFGVIDERMDLKLLDQISFLKPEWNFEMVGPIVKIDPATLPQRKNIIYTGQKSYEELPEIIRNWNAAIIPFARNESTEFISPTKVLEYLAAEKPVVSTSIRDVVFPYGVNNIVSIADEPHEFVNAIEHLLKNTDVQEWKHKVEKLLMKTSWQKTWEEMDTIMWSKLQKRNILKTERNESYV